MKHIFFVFILLALVLGACAPAAATPTILPTPAPSGLPSPTLSASATPAIIPPTSAPAATSAPTQKAPATPAILPSATSAASVINATQTAPDCTAFPGFPTCGATVPLSGKLALFDTASQTITVLDFNARQSWKITPPLGTQRLAWLGGNFLLTYDNQDQPSLVWADPAHPGSFHLPQPSPYDTPIFEASDFSTAWMEMRDTQFFFHVRLGPSGPEQVWPAGASGDQIHEILGWVPGAALLLAGSHFSSNSMWMTGDRLYTLDPASGTIKELQANLRLGAPFQWHPSQTGLMVFGDSNPSSMMVGPRLAVLDVITGKVTHLIADKSVIASYPSWTADGKAILHAASKGDSPAAAGDPFALPGVYLTQWSGGATRRLTTPPAGTHDDWPQLLTDGEHFLFLRVPDDGKPVELRLGALDGGLDELVGSGLSQAPPGPFPLNWESISAYAP